MLEALRNPSNLDSTENKDQALSNLIGLFNITAV